jgi:DNA-binding NarL/FixJ family response regulator
LSFVSDYRGGKLSTMNATSLNMITVALVEDEPETSARLMAAMATDPVLNVVFNTSSAGYILDWLQHHAVQVLLVDLGLPDQSGLEVIRACKSIRPQTEIMVVTMFGDEGNMIRAFEAGAAGYLLKDGTEDELAQHIKSLHAGGSPMSPIIARQLLSRMGKSQLKPDADPNPNSNETPRTEPQTTAPSLLTEREEAVLHLLARGYTYNELAKELGVTINTIQTHIRGLYAKLEVHSKSQALTEAKQLGLLGP